MMRRFGEALQRRTGRRALRALVLLLTGLGIALLVAAADLAEQRFALKGDFSFNRITSQSTLTGRVLSELREPVHIHALFTPGEEDKALIGLLERYGAASRYLSFSVESLAGNPLLALLRSDRPEDAPLSSDCLVIRGERTGRTRILDGGDFIRQSYDPASGSFFISGLEYERSLTEAILYVTADELPTVQILTGHDELTPSVTGHMEEVLRGGGLETRRVSLLRGDALESGGVLMILSPKKDLTGPELAAIQSYLGSGGSLLITSDFDDPFALERFDALFLSFGFRKKEGVVVAEASDTASYFESPAYLLPYMEKTEATEALIAQGKDTLLLAGARAFTQPEQSRDGSLIVQTVLRSGNAYLRQFLDDAQSMERRPGDETGVFPLALFASRAHGDGSRSRAFIIGNSSVFTDSWLYANSYSADFLFSLLAHLGRLKPESLDIQPREAVRPPLVAGHPAAVLAVLIALPLLAALTGAAVLFRRRRT